MKKFDEYPLDKIEGYTDSNTKTLSFFKKHSFTKKELVIVDENHEDSPLLPKLMEMKEKPGYEVELSDFGPSLFLFDKPFPFVYGHEDGFNFFILPKVHALEL